MYVDGKIEVRIFIQKKLFLFNGINKKVYLIYIK